MARSYECAHCDKPIKPNNASQSTYCGSMHTSCFLTHITRCGVCYDDAKKHGIIDVHDDSHKEKT